MRILGNVSVILFLLLAFGCDRSQSECDKLRAENNNLKKEIDELKNGADRLAAQAMRAFEAGNFSAARDAIKSLAAQHPESPKTAKLLALLPEIDAAEKQILARKEAENEEHQRITNMSRTGIWVVRQYVDEFGKKTASRYITSRSRIEGEFGNSATEGSHVGADLLIDSPSQVAIQLYEYDGNNPVKGGGSEAYRVAMQDADGRTYEFKANNFSDRLVLDLTYSNGSFYEALALGGTVKFRIRSVGGGISSTYSFEVDATGFGNAVRLQGMPVQP